MSFFFPKWVSMYRPDHSPSQSYCWVYKFEAQVPIKIRILCLCSKNLRFFCTLSISIISVSRSILCLHHRPCVSPIMEFGISSCWYRVTSLERDTKTSKFVLVCYINYFVDKDRSLPTSFPKY